jgi:hypothetical protein
MSILNTHKTEVEKRYGTEKDVLEETMEEDDLEFMVFAKAKAMELAVQAAEAHKVNQDQLAEQMLEDPDIMKNLRKKYRIRKKGFAEGAEPTA